MKAKHEPVIGGKYIVKTAKPSPTGRNPYRLSWTAEVQTLVKIVRAKAGESTHPTFVMERPDGSTTQHYSKLALQKLAV